MGEFSLFMPMLDLPNHPDGTRKEIFPFPFPFPFSQCFSCLVEAALWEFHAGLSSCLRDLADPGPFAGLEFPKVTLTRTFAFLPHPLCAPRVPVPCEKLILYLNFSACPR